MTAEPTSVLSGQRILITRPLGRADELMAALQQAGAVPMHVPLLEIAPLAEDDPAWQQARSTVLDLDLYGRVIAISVNAVAAGMRLISDCWPQLPVGIRWYGIGAATQAAFASWDIEAVAAEGSMTSEALLALPDFAALAGERVLILRGVGGRELLASTLRERGARVDYAECYRRQILRPTTALAAALSPAPAAVCLNSGETLAAFVAALPPPLAQWRELPLVVPAVRLADAAADHGFRRIQVAANAGTDATLRALNELACR